VGKERSLCFITYILEGKNKGMVTERTPLGIKSKQTHDRCLLHTRKKRNASLLQTRDHLTVGLAIVARHRKSGLMRSS